MEALVADTLADALQALASPLDTPDTPALRAQVRVCERAIAHWREAPPSEAQIGAMLSLVPSLYNIAAEQRRR